MFLQSYLYCSQDKMTSYVNWALLSYKIGCEGSLNQEDCSASNGKKFVNIAVLKGKYIIKSKHPLDTRQLFLDVSFPNDNLLFHVSS